MFLFSKKENTNSIGKQKPFRIYYLFVYITLLTVISAAVRLRYPIDVWRTWLIPVEVAHIPQYLSLFLIGVLFNRHQWLESFKLSTGITLFMLGACTYILQKILPAAIKNYWLTESFVESLLCVAISMTLLTFFRHYGNRTNAFISSLSNNAYGIYLFHLFIVIALQKFSLGWNINANIKFIAVTAGGILISLGLSALLRKSRIVRKVL